MGGGGRGRRGTGNEKRVGASQPRLFLVFKWTVFGAAELALGRKLTVLFAWEHGSLGSWGLVCDLVLVLVSPFLSLLGLLSQNVKEK